MAWESRDLIEDTVAAVQRYSSPDTRIIVVDNASTDGTAEWLLGRSIKTIALRANYGHGPALDLGFLASRTRTVVALDADAFPIARDWLDKLEAGLADGATVSGAPGDYMWQDLRFVHPCCAAMRLRRFVWRHHTFRQVRTANRSDWKDVGVAISERERGRLNYLEPTSVRGPGPLGSVFADAVYHNFYGARLRRDGERVERYEVTPEVSRQAWHEAIARYLRDPDR